MNLASILTINPCHLLLCICAGFHLVSGDVKEYCQDESFTANCPSNQVILMESARYGRMKIGRCVQQSLGYLGCIKDVLRFLDARCSGQQNCELTMMDTNLREFMPCPKDVTWHLEASYRCVDVLTASVHDCHTKHHSLITAQSGYLSSMVATKTSAGTASCPWRIQTPLGQKVNVTLLNFVMSTTSSVWSSPPESAGGTGGGRIPTKTPLELCYDVAAIRDETTKRSVTACSSEPRMRSVYLSTGSQIEIEFAVRNLMAQQTSSPSVQFLILFEAVGCPSVTSPPGMTLTRQGDTLSMRCNISGELWYLTCTGTKWTGTLGNCSGPANHVWNTEEFFGQAGSFPFGILLVVAVGVALGVFLGGTLLLIASIFMKRQRYNQQSLDQQLQLHAGSCPIASAEDGKPFEATEYLLQQQQQQQHLQARQMTDTGSTKHYVIPDYIHRDLGDAMTFDGGRTPVDCGVYDVDYSSRDRKHVQTSQNAQNARIMYHLYESPQLT